MSTCHACSGGAGIEFFEQQPQAQQQTPPGQQQGNFPCQKEYTGCVYSASGALLCNLKQGKQPGSQTGNLSGTTQWMGMGSLLNPQQ